MTLAEIMESSRIFALRRAVAASFAELLPDVTVREHVGKLDISDVLAKDIFVTPSINVAITKAARDERLSRADDVALDVTLYIVADNRMIEGRLVTGDELAIGLFEACFVALSDDNFARWSLDEDIATPDDVRGGPLFTIKSATQGVVYYALTFRQELYALAPTIFPEM